MPDLFTLAPSTAPTSKRRADGPAHVSPEEFERQRCEADIAAALERLRKRLAAPAIHC